MPVRWDSYTWGSGVSFGGGSGDILVDVPLEQTTARKLPTIRVGLSFRLVKMRFEMVGEVKEGGALY